jgi:hypothetical protein
MRIVCRLNRWIVALLFASLPGFPTAAADTNSEKVILTFATVGDSRWDKTIPGFTAQDVIWQQNVKALSRILREIQAQKPAALFFNGDMIMAYTTNQFELDREYAYWRGMTAGLPETGTYVVPIPGNHEMQIKVKGPGPDPEKVAQPACESAWRRNLGDLIMDTNQWLAATGAPVEAWNVDNAPAVGGPDHIQTDQRQLSYSFDSRHIHFAVINTDAVGNDSHAPVHWLADDFAAARARGDRNFFVFGHKMAFTYHFNPAFKNKGLDAFPENCDAFWKIIQDYDATYFCGHEHIYHSMQPRASGGHNPWQVIVGSGGSPFEAAPGASSNPNDRKYAWALVRVYANGRVRMEARGFDEHFGPTETIESIELAPGH